VLAESDSSNPSIYEEGNALILRCFKSGSPMMWWQLLKAVRKFPEVKKILVQFDLSMYGGMLSSGMIIPFLLALRIFKKHVVLVSHHVVLDVKKLGGHMGLGSSLFDVVKTYGYNWSFWLFSIMLGLSAKKIVVLEEALKQRLAKVIPSRKVECISHAVDSNLRKISKKLARKKLGIGQNEQVVLFFGFVNWFKGADIFVNEFSRTKRILGKKAKFIVAGGSSPTMRNKKHYQEYFYNFETAVAESKNVYCTGYVPQNLIAYYFAASDLVVFPYRYFMCASGVLSLVFSYQKPFIVSDKLKVMFSSGDLQELMSETGIKLEDFTFELKKGDMRDKVVKMLRNGLRKKMKKFARIAGQNRSFASSAYMYSNVLQPKDKAKFSGVPALLSVAKILSRR
jgi:glycosyltransferase involved in cell wall biosynthesis